MVWWVNRYTRNYCRTGVHFGLNVAVDHIFQTINIMLDCHNMSYDVYDIRALMATGVNIFNIDVTVHGFDYYEKMKSTIQEADGLCETYPSTYCRPVGVSITMSVLEPVEINDEVDIIILKNVTKKEQFLEFKKNNEKWSSLPILLWLTDFNIENTNELIKISDGIIWDVLNDNFIEVCDVVTQRCKKTVKPVIHLLPKLAVDYYETRVNDRQILTIVSQFVHKGVDGVMLVDGDRLIKPPTEIVFSLVKAMRIAEDDLQVDKAYFKLSFEMEIPILPPLSTAMAASLGALMVGAKAIIIMTVTGRTAHLISAVEPPCIVLAITARKETARRIHLYRKVVPLFYDKARAHNWHQEWRNRVDFGTDFGFKTGLFCVGAKLVVLAPSQDGVGFCDSFQIVPVSFKCNEGTTNE